MNTPNPYLPPSAPLAHNSGNSQFYIVSNTKFWCLFMLTLGMYQIYWNYKHWANYKESARADIWPVPRAIFAIFFYHQLAEKIHERATINQISSEINLKTIATLLVVFTLASSFFSRMGEKMIGALSSNIMVLLIAPVLAYLFSFMQRSANAACGDPTGSTNSNFNAANYIWMALGVMLWLLMLVGIWVIATGG